MFNICIPLLYKLDAFLFKTLMLSQDLMLGGMEFHSEVVVEAKFFLLLSLSCSWGIVA